MHCGGKSSLVLRPRQKEGDRKADGKKRKKNLKGMRTVFLTASIQLGLDDVFLKYLFLAH